MLVLVTVEKNYELERPKWYFGSCQRCLYSAFYNLFYNRFAYLTQINGQYKDTYYLMNNSLEKIMKKDVKNMRRDRHCWD